MIQIIIIHLEKKAYDTARNRLMKWTALIFSLIYTRKERKDNRHDMHQRL